MNVEQLELEKLQMEMEKTKAERNFLEVQIKLEKQELKYGGLTLKNILQTLIVGVVAAGLLSAWAITYLGEIIPQKQNLQKVKYELLSIKLNKEREKLKKLNTIFSNKVTEFASLKKELIEFKEINDHLAIEITKSIEYTHTSEKVLENNIQKYQDLLKKNEISNQRRNEIVSELELSKRKLNFAKDDLKSLKISSNKLKKNDKHLNSKLLSNDMLVDTTWNFEFSKIGSSITMDFENDFETHVSRNIILDFRKGYNLYSRNSTSETFKLSGQWSFNKSILEFDLEGLGVFRDSASVDGKIMYGEGGNNGVFGDGNLYEFTAIKQPS